MNAPGRLGLGVFSLALLGCPAGSGDSQDGTESATGSTDTSGGEEPGALEIEVVHHSGQSMVVDLLFSAPGLSVELTHLDDPGVRSELLDSAGPTRVRVRGLAPGSAHTLAWVASDAEGQTHEGELELTTLDPQPGYIPSFAIEGEPLPGYLLMDHMSIVPGYASLFVVDGQGTTRWHIGRPAPQFGADSVFGAAKLSAEGNLSYVRANSMYVIDELGNEQLRINSPTLGVAGLHHELRPLDNGNYLSMSYIFQDVEDGEPEPRHVAGDLLLELSPAGEIVWQWNSFEHLDPLRERDGYDFLITNPATGQSAFDWTHGNALIYEPETDSYLFSTRNQDWIIRIDRQSGEIVWRLGDEGDFSLESGEWFFHQHTPQWQPDGSLLLYDNGIGNPYLDDDLEHSRAVRFVLDEDSMSATQVWEDAEEPFVAPIGGDTDRFDAGRVMITDSSRDMLEGEMHARIRLIEEAQPAEARWTLTTEALSFVYRSTYTERLPGQPE